MNYPTKNKYTTLPKKSVCKTFKLFEQMAANGRSCRRTTFFDFSDAIRSRMSCNTKTPILKKVRLKTFKLLDQMAGKKSDTHAARVRAVYAAAHGVLP